MALDRACVGADAAGCWIGDAYLCICALIRVSHEHVVQAFVSDTLEKPLYVHPWQPIESVEAQRRVLDEHLARERAKAICQLSRWSRSIGAEIGANWAVGQEMRWGRGIDAITGPSASLAASLHFSRETSSGAPCSSGRSIFLLTRCSSSPTICCTCGREGF